MLHFLSRVKAALITAGPSSRFLHTHRPCRRPEAPLLTWPSWLKRRGRRGRGLSPSTTTHSYASRAPLFSLFLSVFIRAISAQVYFFHFYLKVPTSFEVLSFFFTPASSALQTVADTADRKRLSTHARRSTLASFPFFSESLNVDFSEVLTRGRASWRGDPVPFTPPPSPPWLWWSPWLRGSPWPGLKSSKQWSTKGLKRSVVVFAFLCQWSFWLSLLPQFYTLSQFRGFRLLLQVLDEHAASRR